MRRWISILFLVVAVGCSKSDAPKQVPLTVVMYLVGENDLKYDLQQNIAQTTQGITGKFDGRIIVMFDGGAGDTWLGEVVPPKKANGRATVKHLIEYDDLVSTDPATMQRVLGDVKRLAPARHYGIILASHGCGWFPPGATDLQSQRIMALDRRPEHDFEWMLGGGTRSFGADRGSWNYTMSTEAMVEGLSPIHFDFLMFDACLMASVELLYGLRNSADYVIASSIEIMQAGFPYQNIMPLFFGAKPLEERLTAVASGFYDYYATSAQAIVGRNSAAISVVKLSQMDGLASKVYDIYRAGVKDVDVAGVKGLEGLAEHAFFDLNDYLKQLAADGLSYSKYIAQFERTVIYTACTEQIYSGFDRRMTPSEGRVCGLSVYIPREQFPVTAALWYQTEWCKRVY